MNHSNGVVVRADRLPDFRTVEEWGAGLHWLIGFNRRWRWLLGEYLVRGEEIFHEKIWQYIGPADLKMKSKQDVNNAMYVYRHCKDQYTPEIEEWTFWQSMAALTPQQRSECITRALSPTGISRDEIRAMKNASDTLLATEHRNGAKNGSAGTGTQASPIPSELSLLENEVAEAYVAVGRLMSRGDRGPRLSAALDELIEKAMALREKLAD